MSEQMPDVCTFCIQKISIREKSAYRQIIHDNIEYDILCQSYRAESIERYRTSAETETIASILAGIFQQLLIGRPFFSRSMRNEFLTVDLEDGNEHSVPKPLEVNLRWSDKNLIHF